MLEAGESVMVYQMSSEKYVERNVFGEDPMDDQQFL
jgi:CRISPR-associated protein Cas2